MLLAVKLPDFQLFRITSTAENVMEVIRRKRKSGGRKALRFEYGLFLFVLTGDGIAQL